MKYKTMKVSREQLYEEIWSDTMGRTAAKYDVPYSKFKQVCIDANIPLPSNAYWGYLQLGDESKIIKPPLPGADIEFVDLPVRDHDAVSKINKQLPSNQLIEPKKNIPDKREEINIDDLYSDDVLSFLDQPKRKLVLSTAAKLKIFESNKKIHRVIKAHEAAVKKWSKTTDRDPLAQRKYDLWSKKPDDMPELCDKVSVGALPRIYRILNSIYYAVV